MILDDGGREAAKDFQMFRPLSVMLVLVVGQLVGCYASPVIDDYPKWWPSLDTTEVSGCPDVSGLYQNAPTDTTSSSLTDNGVPPSLYDEIANEGAHGLHDCPDCIVQLSWVGPADNTLSVELNGATRASAILTAAAGDFTCENGTLTVKILAVSEYGIFGVYDAGESAFRLAGDGSLVTERNIKSSGHELFIPAYMRTRSFWRWPKLPEDLPPK